MRRPSFRQVTLLLSGCSWGMYLWKQQLKACVTQMKSQTYPLGDDDCGPKWLPFFWQAFHLESVHIFLYEQASYRNEVSSFIFFSKTQFLLVFKNQMGKLRNCVLQCPRTRGFLYPTSKSHDLFYLWNVCFSFLCFKTLSACRNPSSYWKPVMTSSSKC